MDFFDTSNIKSLDELKKQYKKLALIFHPDIAGRKPEEFQAMKNEYDLIVNNYLRNGNFTTEQIKNEVQIDEAYKTIIDLFTPYNVNIELIGSWIWISGERMIFNEDFIKMLKGANFRFASLKKMWYLNTTGERPKHRGKTMDIDKIRTKYGSKGFKGGKGGKTLNGVKLAPSKTRALKLSLNKLIKAMSNKKTY